MRILLIALLVLTATGCSPWYLRPCLSSESPGTRFVRDGWREANDPDGSWKTRICATASVITHSSSGEHPGQETACNEEILDHLTTELFQRTRLPYNRLQLARLEGITRARQTTDHMSAKVRAILEVAAIEVEDLEEYEMTPGESGPPLDREVFRRMALRALGNVHLAMNDEEIRREALARRHRATHPIDRRLLQSFTAHHLTDTLWGQPRAPVDKRGSFALFDRVLAETAAALERPHDEVEHGLLLDDLHVLGFLARRFGREGATARVLRRILDAEGRVPSVRGRPAARRDLFVAAALAEIECHADQALVGARFAPWYEAPPRDEDKAYFDPALYERGFDCRGQGAADLFLPKLLSAFDAGTLTWGEPPSRDAVRLVELVPARPHEVVRRPALQTLLLTHAEILQSRARTVWHWDDPLSPLVIALTSSAPAAPEARAFAGGILDAARKQPSLWGISRELLVVARHAKRLGMEAEVHALARELAVRAEREQDPEGASFASLAVAGVRASLAAAAFEPW